MRNFAWKPLFYLGGIVLLVLSIVEASNYMLRIGYADLAKRPPDWAGTVTGGACQRNSDCGQCGSRTQYLPPGLQCQCLPKYAKCGIGRNQKSVQ